MPYTFTFAGAFLEGGLIAAYVLRTRSATVDLSFHLCLPFLCAKMSPGISSTESAPSNPHLKFEGPLLSRFTRERATGYDSAPELPGPGMTLPDISGLLTFSCSQSPTADLAREKLPLSEAPPSPTSPSSISVSTSASTLTRPVTSEVPSLTSLERLEHETQLHRMEQIHLNQESTQTGRSYNRHVQNFEKFWHDSQLERKKTDPSWVHIPLYPITATKVAIFLKYETTRPKVSLPSALTCSWRAVTESVSNLTAQV